MNRQQLFSLALAAVAAAGSLAAQDPGRVTARVSAKRVLDGNGASNWTIQQINTWMAQANQLFERSAQISLALTETVNVTDPGTPSPWFDVDGSELDPMETAAMGNPSAYAWRDNAINVYFVNSIDNAGGICSFTDGLNQEIIVVAPGIANAAAGLAHEIGHYFNLRHTHANFEGSAGVCDGGLAGDCVADTPNDVNPAMCRPFTTACHDGNFTAMANAQGFTQAQRNAILQNIMSYHTVTQANALLTTGQAIRARLTAIFARNHVLELNAERWIANYAANIGGWTPDRHPRMLSDVNGDGRDDVVGFGDAGAYVSLSDGSSFRTAQLWVSAYGYGGAGGSWRVDQHPRLMADVDGDGRDDIVGFGWAGAYVSLSTGSSFTSPSLGVANYGYSAGGWRVDRHPRMMADVNGDGRDDIVGFGNSGVHVALSNGSGFQPVQQWVTGYGYDQGWRVERHPRMMADVNGDGRADVVGFANAGAYVSLSTGSAFTTAQLGVGAYGYNDSWQTEYHPRMLADVNGDGRDDIVGFGWAGAYVSLSLGSTFATPQLWVENYAYNAGGWRVDAHARMLADVNEDGRADIVGCGDNATWVSLSTGTGFETPRMWVANYGSNTGGWDLPLHPRAIADVNGDGRADLVGFGENGVYVSANFGGLISAYGPSGAPQLSARVSFPTSGTRGYELRVTNAPAQPLNVWVIGLSRTSAPLPGGLLLATPDVVLLATVDATGAGSFSFELPTGISTFFAQFGAGGAVWHTSRGLRFDAF